MKLPSAPCGIQTGPNSTESLSKRLCGTPPRPALATSRLRQGGTGAACTQIQNSRTKLLDFACVAGGESFHRLLNAEGRSAILWLRSYCCDQARIGYKA